MKRRALTKAAISSLVILSTVAGVSVANGRSTPKASKSKISAAKMADAAEKALSRQDRLLAIQKAEAAVQAEPNNGTFRQLLGRAYLADGRFRSAETALTDALTMNILEAKTVVNLALVEVTLGKNADAVQLLRTYGGVVPAADYGLAMAMAGEPEEGIGVLTDAANDGSATVRTRQNLAYAYALAGRWKDARVLVGQDMEAIDANQRIAQWASMADPAFAPQRVAALLGVSINDNDGGMPTALALAPQIDSVPETTPAPSVQMASAEIRYPVAQIQPTTFTPPVVEVRSEALQVQNVPASTPVVVKVSAPETPVVVSASRAVVQPRQAKAPPRLVTENTAFSVRPASVGKSSDWVVQLGAYDTEAIAKLRWTDMTRRSSELAAFPVLTSQTTVNGKGFHRLLISGFENRSDAQTMCRLIQSRRGICFVREVASNAVSQRWVAAKGRQLAVR